MENVVPLDWAVVEFPGNQFRGEVAPELFNLVESGLIRIIDAVFISKDPDGNYTALELNQLSDEEYSQFMPWREYMQSWFTDEDVENAAAAVRPNSSALVLLWQNIWTEQLRRAIANANGQILIHERVPAEVLNEVMAEMSGGAV
jgi:uncharacterized membrane protein